MFKYQQLAEMFFKYLISLCGGCVCVRALHSVGLQVVIPMDRGTHRVHSTQSQIFGLRVCLLAHSSRAVTFNST